MKKEEYLHKALLLVSNPYTKAQVQRELEDHIEDEISFYTDAGYEREKAENMAMSRMGAPEEMARELGRLHRNLPGRVLGFSALAACVGLSMLYWFSDQWSYSLYAVMPDWLVYTLLFGNVLAVLAATTLAFRWAWKCKDPVLLVGHGLFCVVSGITQYLLWYDLFTLLFCLTLDIPAALAMDTPFLLDFALEGVSPWQYFSQWKGWNMDWMYNVQFVLSFLPLVLAVVDFICAGKIHRVNSQTLQQGIFRRMPVIGRILVALTVCAAVSLGVSNGVDALCGSGRAKVWNPSPYSRPWKFWTKPNCRCVPIIHRRIMRRAWLQMKRPFTRAYRIMSFWKIRIRMAYTNASAW